MLWLEQKYINLLSSSLENFKKQSSQLYNFRCPICGDSAKNKSKARGYVFLKGNHYVFFCHNCNASKKFTSLLKELNRVLYDQYLMEKFAFDNPQEESPYKPVIIQNNDKLLELTKVSSLHWNHPAKKYVVERQIPTTIHHEIFFTDDFKGWTNSIIQDKFSTVTPDSRLVLPLFTRENIMFGYTGRSIDPNASVRYILIIMDETQPKIYGINRVNFNQKYYIFEGPIDSLFIQNSVAICGSHLGHEMDLLSAPKENAVVVYDNQPRNKDVIKSLARAIKQGYNVCVWPPSMEEKDINEMILSRVKERSFVNTEKVLRIADEIKHIIDTNTFAGLEAELQLSSWKKSK